jgi:uncharacterized peroxidase-related enzyme
MTILPLDPSATARPTRQILDDVARVFGRAPNAVRALATSQVALNAWWSFERALAASAVPKAVREQIAVLTATTNDCAYCASTHGAAARAALVSRADVLAAADATASDPTAQAALRFADAALRHRGDVPARDLAAARDLGLSDAFLLEVLAVVGINTFNNYYVRFCKPALD